MFNYLIILLISLNFLSKEYVKNYTKSGILISEGWIKSDKKVDFWTFYYDNGTVEKKGHFINNKKNGYWYFYSEDKKLLKEGSFKENMLTNWWIFYANDKKIKVQYKNGKKNGFALIYFKNSLKKVEKYIDDEKTGEWTSYLNFKKDNPNIKF